MSDTLSVIISVTALVVAIQSLVISLRSERMLKDLILAMHLYSLEVDQRQGEIIGLLEQIVYRLNAAQGALKQPGDRYALNPGRRVRDSHSWSHYYAIPKSRGYEECVTSCNSSYWSQASLDRYGYEKVSRYASEVYDPEGGSY